jgi:hypothetical protein
VNAPLPILFGRPYTAPAIIDRPSPHNVCAFLRARGWTYHPTDRLPWHLARLAVMTADEALSLELGEPRMELRGAP